MIDHYFSYRSERAGFDIEKVDGGLRIYVWWPHRGSQFIKSVEVSPDDGSPLARITRTDEYVFVVNGIPLCPGERFILTGCDIFSL